MSSFNALKINTDNDILTRDKWNGFVDTIAEKIKLTVPTNKDGIVERGLIMNGITAGTKPSNTVNYPWEYETVGVKQANFNLRLQSPRNVYFHTGINTDLEKNKTRIPLTILSNGQVGVGTTTPDKIFHIHSPTKDNGLKITSEGNKQSIHLHLADNSWGQYGYLNLGGNTNLRGNGKVSNFEGNLGIGIVQPKYTLHAYSKIKSNGLPPLRVETNWGHMDIGARNSSYAHFYTNLPRFYFNKNVIVDGVVKGYKSGTGIIEGKLGTKKLPSKNGKKTVHNISFGWEYVNLKVGIIKIKKYVLHIYVNGKKVHTIFDLKPIG